MIVYFVSRCSKAAAMMMAQNDDDDNKAEEQVKEHTAQNRQAKN